MHVSAENNLVFLMPTKTGTVSFKHFLDSCGAKQLTEDRHQIYDDVVRLNPQLVGYKFMAFFRDPLDRFLSACRYSHLRILATTVWKDPNKINVDNYIYPETVYEEFVDNFGSKRPFIFSPQTRWVKNAEPLDYKNYNFELLKIAKIFNKQSVVIHKLNTTPKCNVKPSQKVIDFVRSYYDEDYRFGRERGLLT